MTVTKYHADVLTDEIAERVGEIASDISEGFGVDIQNVNGGSDHVHILFTAKPTTDLDTDVLVAVADLLGAMAVGASDVDSFAVEM